MAVIVIHDAWRIATDAGLVAGEPPADLAQWARELVRSGKLADHPTIKELHRLIDVPKEIAKARWVTIEDRARVIRSMLRKLPGDVCAVAGVPRSGMAPAGELAMLLHVPLLAMTPEGGLSEVGNGWRMRRKPAMEGSVLVVDDTIASGASFRKLSPALELARRKHRIVTAAVYCSPERVGDVDIVGETLNLPHYLEWNFANSIHAEYAATDFDGILCHDPPDWSYDDDAERYRWFLDNARPLYPFRLYPIRLVVTARLEKYRVATMHWLAKHRIAVRKLVMYPSNELQVRRRANIGEWKAKHYAASECPLFVESDPDQAREIAKVSRKPVLCPIAGIFQP